MPVPQTIVDSFTDRPFSGNPAGECRLDAWPDDAWLQAVAAEMNLSETAFLVPRVAWWACGWPATGCSSPGRP